MRGATFTTQFDPSMGVTVLTATGDIDASNHAEFDLACAGIAAAHPASVLVDLRRVTFFSVASTDVLYAAGRILRSESTSFTVLVSRAVERALRITDPAHTLPVSRSFTEAFPVLETRRTTFRASA